GYMGLLCRSMAWYRTLVAKKKGIDSTWIESGDLKQCDTFFKNLLPAQIYASSGPIGGSVKLNLDYYRRPFGIKCLSIGKTVCCLRRFSWGSVRLCARKGEAKTKCARLE